MEARYVRRQTEVEGAGGEPPGGPVQSLLDCDTSQTSDLEGLPGCCRVLDDITPSSSPSHKSILWAPLLFMVCLCDPREGPCLCVTVCEAPLYAMGRWELGL